MLFFCETTTETFFETQNDTDTLKITGRVSIPKSLETRCHTLIIMKIMSTWSRSTCLGRGQGQGGRERDGTGEEGSSLFGERGDLRSRKVGDSHFVDEGMFLGEVWLFQVEDQWRSYCFAQLSVLLTSLSPAGGQATLLRTLSNSLLGNTKPKRRTEGTKSKTQNLQL